MTTKQHYNMELSRYKDAEKYMNRLDVSISEKEKWVPEFRKIMSKLSTILDTIGDYTVEEGLEGFGYEEDMG